MPLYYTILIFDYFVGAIFYLLKQQNFIEIFGINGNRGLKYMRYFLFIHSIVPSDNYEKWNNRLGLWTMSCFFVFYVFMPLFFKILRKWQSTALLTLILMLINKTMIELMKILVDNNGFDQADYFSQSFPLNNLWCFLLGVLLWQIRESDYKFIMIGLCILIAVFSQMRFHGYEMLLAALTIVSYSVPIKKYISGTAEKIIIKFSEMSFCLYLIHLIVLKALIRINNYIGLSGWFGFVVMFLICTGSCWIFYSVFEQGKNKLISLVRK